MSLRRKKRLRQAIVLAVMIAAALAGAMSLRGNNVIAGRDLHTAEVKRGKFRQSVLRVGYLKPLKEQRIMARVAGVILEMAPQGKVVAKDEVILRLDPGPHEDLRVAQEAQIAEQEAEFKKLQQEAAKILNAAREDVASYDLRLELEQMRLAEIKKGPTAMDVVNARVALENARNLMSAKDEEMKVLQGLAAFGYASREEVRQKQLDVVEQKLAVEQAEIKTRRINIIDPVKLGDQELKVKDAIKMRDNAKEKVELLERNMQRDEERHKQKMERERDRLLDLTQNVKRTVHLAPGPGVVVHRRGRWFAFAPGREVWDGMEIMALPDFTRMKVSLTVDEGRIGYIQVGQEAEIRPAGWTGTPFKGRVTTVAEKGRDEFEVFQDETIAITGTANRQVFEVEVEILDQAQILRPGLRADVEIVMQTLDNALIIPRTGLVRDKEGTPVVYPAGSATPKKVKVLAENDLSAAIEGLEEGERVLVVDHPQ
ncbi:MAG TPA: hypothetical protein VEK08_10235 [Planctomycetota bacterium]|nr:hypothetical protein [Planctomycetota bacterium]